MGKMLYLECASGISGDMLVAALLDLGANRQVLLDALARLPLDGYEVRVGRAVKAGIDACDFAVLLDAAHENHDHDMAYLYGETPDGEGCSEHAHAHAHTHGHTHTHAPTHEHDHGHDGRHGHHHAHGEAGDQVPHAHRTLADVRQIISAAHLSPRAASIAVRTFEILAEAEAKAHGTTPDRVHFHEVGAVDSIVDIVASAVCLDDLDAADVVVPALHEGHGMVRCAHGVLPVPVPAVLEIVRAHGIPLAPLGAKGEYVTPTGAALAAAIRTPARLPESFTVVSAGYGAGKRDHEVPGLLRAMLIEPLEVSPSPSPTPTPASAPAPSPAIWKLEADIDDSTGEALGYVLERLFAAGAREAHFAPVFMKKNRPAYQLQVICDEALVSDLETIVFRETTTIGIRRVPMQRSVLPRRMDSVATPFGDVAVKYVELPDGEKRAYPEHDSVAAAARAHDAAFMRVYRAAVEAAAAAGMC